MTSAKTNPKVRTPAEAEMPAVVASQAGAEANGGSVGPKAGSGSQSQAATLSTAPRAGAHGRRRSRRTIDMSQPDDIVNYGTGARLRAIVISLSSLTVLGAIVVGIPALLVRLIGHPLPNGVPPWVVIRAHLEAGHIPTPAIVSLLAMLAWLLWFTISLPILVELISAIRGVATPKIAIAFPGSGVLARRLVAGIFVVSTSMSSLAAATPALAAVAVAPQQLAVEVPAAAELSELSMRSSTAEPASDPVGGVQRYIVGSGETLRSIAAETLGDANRWKEVRMASVGLVQPDGSRLPEDIIRVTEGTVLHLPADAVSASGEQVGGEAAAAAPTTSRAASRTITVAKGNHFWGLAERTLTDAWGRSPSDAEITPYWAQVVQHNADRLVRPGDPNLIYPDQQFLLPPVPVDSAQHSAGDGQVDLAALRATLALLPDAGATVEPAVSAESPYSRSQVADAAKARESAQLADAEKARELAGGAKAGASAQLADAEKARESAGGAKAPIVDMPAGDHGAVESEVAGPSSPTRAAAAPTSPAAPRTAEAPAPAPAPARSVEGAATPVDTPADPGSADLTRWVIGGIGTGLMMAALTQAIARRRRRQWQTRSEGRLPAAVSAEAQVAEASIRRAADPDRLASTEAALRSLSPLLPVDAPAVTSIAVSSSDLILTLDRFCEPPGLFTSAEDSPLWRLQTDDDAVRAELVTSAGNVAMLPALITLGHDPKSERDILVDLEHVLALDVVGSEPSARQFVRTLAAELAASPFAEDVDVICCGFGHELCGLQRVVLVDSVEEACAEARRRQHDESPGVSPLERRLRRPGDAPTPVVLLTAEPVDDGERAKLQELSLHGVIVVAPGIDAKWSVALLPGGLRVEPLGLKLLREDFTDDQFAALGELIEATDATAPEVEPEPLQHVPSAVAAPAGAPADVAAPAVAPAGITPADVAAPAVAPAGITPADVAAPAGAPADVTPADVAAPAVTPGGEPTVVAETPVCDIEVQVLGTVDILGADRDFSSARAIDVISYLVFHRDGANADVLKTWIWPIDEPPSDKAFANVMSRARKGLGTDDDGQPYLTRADAHGNYRLLPSVRSDVDRFERVLAQAEHAVGDDRIDDGLALFRDALALVRGVPFTGGGARGFLWADNGVRAQVEFLIDEAAHRCADLAIEADDLDTARAAAFRGLSVIPWCEGCYRRRFRIAAADGNRTELKSAMADLEAVLAADADEPEGSDLLSPETLAMYSKLLRSPMTDASADAVSSSAAGG